MSAPFLPFFPFRPMRDLLSRLPKPSHYAGNEVGAVRRKAGPVAAHVGLAFPDLYEIGMSYLGQKILYETVNAIPYFLAERVFAPSLEAADILREAGEPLCTLETDTPLQDLDAVCFSLTHELCYTNVLYMLDLGRIPLRADQRVDTDPLVIAGGGCAFNAEPLAPFLDLMVLGEGEQVILELLEALALAKKERTPRRDLLFRLKDIPGVYVPSLFADQGPRLPPKPLVPGYARVEKRLVPDLDQAPHPVSAPLAFEAVHDRLSLEIARGCSRSCRFCQAGMLYRPVRERSLDTLEDILRTGLASTGYGEVSFLSLSSGDFSALAGLFQRTFPFCRQEQVAISLPSLRVGSVDEDIMACIADIRRTGVTIAPEAGSQRLRNVINKGITEEELLAHTAQLFEQGWQAVKLYFMIGLPTETDEDLRAIVDLCRKVEATAGPRPGRLQVTASISTFVPKPHTPFQWEAQMGLEETRRRLDLLRNEFRPYRRIKVRWHMPEMSFLEGVFSRGDRSLAGLVEQAYAKRALFSSWNDKLNLAPWLEAMQESGVDPMLWLAARSPEEPLPWDHLSCGVSKDFLLTERRRGMEEKITPDCRYQACRDCGVCTLDGRKSQLTAQALSAPIEPRLNHVRRDQTDGVPSLSNTENRTEARENLIHRAVRFRLWYEKMGRAVYLSQLELQGIFERAMRRAGLRLSFSAGFHPMPLVSFCRALPVGVASREEYLDVVLRKEATPHQVMEALGGALPEGLAVTRVEELPLRGKHPQATEEEFLLEFTAADEAAAALTLAWERFRDQTSFAWSRATKTGVKSSDIRPLFREIDLTRPGAVRVMLDWSAGYANPLALIRAAVPELSAVPFVLTKTRQFFPPDEESNTLPAPASKERQDTQKDA